MLTLAPELLAAQTEQSRHPIIEVIAGRLSADFPFTGNSIANSGPVEQSYSSSVFLPDGSLAVLYAVDDALRFIVTDSAVTEFSDFVTIDENRFGPVINYTDSLIMTDGNIGTVVVTGTTTLVFYRISPAGAKIGEVSTGSLGTLLGATVAPTDTGYVAMYIREVSGVYTIYKMTSTDFVTWSTPTAITISGIDNSTPIRDPRLRRLADDSYVLLYAYATLFNDTATVYNLQYSASTDLATWEASVTITDTSEVNEDYIAPSIVQREDGSLFIATQKSSTYLTMTTAASGWNTADPIGITSACVDSAAGKLYIVSRKTYTGADPFYGTAQIDLDTWTIDSFYDENSTPAVPSWFAETDSSPNVTTIDGRTILSYDLAACVIDFGADDITGYYFADYSVSKGAEYTQSVAESWRDDWDDAYNGSPAIISAHIQDNKLWFGFHISRHYINGGSLAVFGYIDLTQITAPYEFVPVGTAAYGEPAGFSFYPDDDIVLTWTDYYYYYGPRLNVLNISSETFNYYHNDTHSDFPRNGVSGAVLVGGSTIYSVPIWNTTYAADHDKWGLMEINIDTDLITYYYPDWITTPGNYLTGDIEVDETAGEVICRTADGVVIFNYLTKTWEQFENTAVDTLPPSYSGSTGYTQGLAYDPTRRFLFYGNADAVYLVPRDGLLNSIEYITGDDVDGWDFADSSLMVSGYSNISPSLAVDDSDVIYGTWTNDSTINWDNTAARINLDEYLVKDIALELRHTINEASELSFSVSHGHLFDVHNDNSLLRPYLAKGRGVSVRIGELIDGVEYWAMQGTYLVRGQRTALKRGTYPVMAITCADKRCLWDDHQIVAINVDSQTPEEALPALIDDNTSFLTEDVTTPTMPLSFRFDAQWLDSYFSDIVDDIAHRFQHFPFIRPDGNMEFRPFDFSATVKNAYEIGQIASWNPDDTYSDLTNRITVTGISLEDFQVMHEEERLGGLSGTVGWWGYKKDKTVYYSEDKQKTAKNPRLAVIETSTSILFKLAGKITERISEEDPYFHYCVVEVKAPNLIPLLVSAIAIYTAGNFTPDLAIQGETIPVGRKIEGVGLLLAMMVLGSVGNYQYEIYGNPIGYVKRTYSDDADDEELQQEVGLNEKVLEGFLCHSQGHCKTVADFEMDLIKAQRSRVTVEKIAHLQDEVGDIVTCPHPATGVDKKIFITGITRTYKPAKGGGLLDSVEGWVL